MTIVITTQTHQLQHPQTLVIRKPSSYIYMNNRITCIIKGMVLFVKV